MANVKIALEWEDFEVLLTGDGLKQERWGKYILIRPEPQAVWPVNSNWQDSHAVYYRSKTGGGYWEKQNKIPEKWIIQYKNLRFYIETMGFKHTGLFPEQAVNWDYMTEKIESAKGPTSVLNLFAYTGGATAACAAAGASVCHVDSAKGIVNRAKRNMELSGLSDKPIRFIVDDAVKFVKREIRRGNKYDGIVMDPPAYGRGPAGELWKIEDALYELVELCSQLMSKNSLFFIINSYASTLSPLLVENILNLIFVKNFGGKTLTYELGLNIKNQDMILPCGFTGRWERK